MTTPLQSALRLLSALEDLVAQETATVETGDFATMAALQERAGAVGEKLGEFAGVPAVLALWPRVEALLSCRQVTRRVLAGRLVAGRSELQRLQVAKQRLAHLRPAYGAGAAGPRFSAAA